MTVTILLVALAGIVLSIISYMVGKKIGALLTDMRWKKELPHIRKLATKQSRSVIGGQVSEQIAPYLPNFPYQPSEARFIGKPVDFLIFKGMDDKQIEEIIFVEVKSGAAVLTPQEQAIKKTIEKGNVRFYEYRVP